jgi:serine protease Do
MALSILSKRRKAWLGAAAVAALVAGGAFEIGITPPVARAEMLSLDKPTQAAPSFADVIERVKPAVVSVRVKMQQVAERSDGAARREFGLRELPDDHPLRDLFRRFEDGDPRGEDVRPRPAPRRFGQAQGSGFFISSDGYVVTNNHVVQSAGEVQIVTEDGRSLEATVVGTDPKTDLALLKVKGGGNFPHVRFATGKTRVGDWVVAIGNPFGLGGTVTAGIVSAHGRNIGAGPYDDFIQIDAAVNRGNSGGPTFNLAGEVVGVNTAIASPSGGSVGIAFAIPAYVAEQVAASLKETGTVARGFIGVQIQPVTREIADAMGVKEARGALVADLVRDGPASKAGLRSGDTITAVDGEAIRDARDLSRKIASYAPGKSVALTVWRDGKERTVTIEIGRQQSGA